MQIIKRRGMFVKIVLYSCKLLNCSFERYEYVTVRDHLAETWLCIILYFIYFAFEFSNYSATILKIYLNFLIWRYWVECEMKFEKLNANEQSYWKLKTSVSSNCLNSSALYYTLKNKNTSRTKLKKMMYILRLF